MPQLHPAPWFTTLVLAWLIMLFMMKPTLMQLQHTPHPAHQQGTKPKPTWTWPWQ